MSVVARRSGCQPFQRVPNRKRTRRLPWREVPERLQVSADDRLRRRQKEDPVDKPALIIAGFVLRSLERVFTQVEQQRHAQRYQRLAPDVEALGPLFHEDRLPAVVSQAGEVAVVGPVEKLSPQILTFS